MTYPTPIKDRSISALDVMRGQYPQKIASYCKLQAKKNEVTQLKKPTALTKAGINRTCAARVFFALSIIFSAALLAKYILSITNILIISISINPALLMGMLACLLIATVLSLYNTYQDNNAIKSNKKKLKDSSYSSASSLMQMYTWQKVFLYSLIIAIILGGFYLAIPLLPVATVASALISKYTTLFLILPATIAIMSALFVYFYGNDAADRMNDFLRSSPKDLGEKNNVTNISVLILTGLKGISKNQPPL